MRTRIRYGKKQMHSFINTIGVLCCSAMLCLWLVGCGSIRLKNAPAIDTDSWQQYGGGMEHTNVAKHELLPPLDSIWSYDASAGYSEYSVSVADGMVFLGTLQGEVFVLNIETGEKLGKYDFGLPVFGTPVIDSGMMYAATANNKTGLFAYDILNGKIKWKQNFGGVETSPLLIQNRLYITTLNGDVYCLNKKTGTVVWKIITPLFERSAFLHSSPASDGKNLVYGCDDGSLFCLSVDDGKLLWRAKTLKSITASPSIRNGVVYIGSQDEHLYAFDINTGKELWKTPLGAKIFSSQAVSNDYVYVGTSAGEVIGLKASSGEIVWRFKAESVIATAPLVSGDVVYAGSLDRTLYALDTKTGKQLWKHSTEGRIKSMPVIWKEYLVLPLDNRMVLGFKKGGAK